MCAWIKSHQEIGRHPKTRRLARALDISIPTAVAHLHLLWHWCLDYAQDGDLSRHAADEIADAVMWEESPQKLIDALIFSGWIDRDLKLSAWGQTCPFKAHWPLRRIWQALASGITPQVMKRDGGVCQVCGTLYDLTIDHIKPISKGGGNEMENLRVLCRSCNSSKGAKYGLD